MENKGQEYRDKCHKLLSEFDEKMITFELSKKDGGYKLEKIRGLSEFKNNFSVFINSYIKVPESSEDSYHFFYNWGYKGHIYNIPDSNKAVGYASLTSRKNKPCRWCGAGTTNNFSLVIGGEVADYFCSYCFFEQNDIEVPEKFFK